MEDQRDSQAKEVGSTEVKEWALESCDCGYEWFQV